MNFTTKENRHARAIAHRDTPGWRVSLWSSLRKLDLYAMRITQINSKKKKTTRRRTGVRFDVIKLTITDRNFHDTHLRGLFSDK